MFDRKRFQARPPFQKTKTYRDKGETAFLAGRQTWLRDFYRICRITAEFFKGFSIFHGIGPAVTVFGSARIDESNPYYSMARDIGRGLAEQGFAVVTGGGPGIMEAANRGALELGGLSIGANIILPEEQQPNPFVNRLVTFYYFFIRKVILLKYSYVYIFLPGGFGTLDEMAESLTLMQTGKLQQFPIVLVGREYWKGLIDWMTNTMLRDETISEHDLGIFTITDSAEQVLEITKAAAERFNLPLKPMKKAKAA